ncbi:putative inner membrane protein [Escherichia coli]|uniref:Putative inner membrane protein n=1 Tax=Escherichia coli TaxID=562 RepID=A0A376RI36_ECOLX|nr:putative inner membrane protein [Escherichia coli]
MVNVRQPRDVAQILLSVLFLAIMIVACLWIVQPFILGFAWAGTVVIATWPVLLRFAKDHVWPPLSRRSGDDAVISDGVYHPYCFAG